ncbi:hypothetical protein CGLAMM_08990 [Acetobacteraceae bacterium EV16G]|uniref:Bacterial transcriptional activator domain-containing protein n=1 Tax=Sorlinia euscelidii TaxID=3081148 RepID=A0ABU7TYF5_9PROT
MYNLPSRSFGTSEGSLLRIRLLGTMGAETSGGLSVLPVGGKTRGLLAILALSDRKPVMRKTIADLLWSNRADDLARASLRQEIHRLLVALNPLGADIVEVQRQALTLKPFLTWVDVEKILHGGIEALQLVPSPSEGLLTELNAIDPAFDNWLAAQRKRLDRHVLSLYSQALAQVEDPEAMLAYAEGLLQRDTMNELGWRGRLQAYVTKGEMGKASRTCAEIMDLFNYRLGALPGPETMRLIREIQAHAASETAEFGFSESQNLFKETEVASREVVANETPTIRSKPAPHRHPVVSGNVPRTLGRVAVEAFSAPSEVHLTPTAFALAEQLEVELVRLDTLQVVFRPGQKSASSASPFFQAAHQAIDFRVVSIVHSGEPREASQRGVDRNWVTIRLISCKDDDYVIWADRLNLPQEEAERNAFNRHIAWSLQWALMIWEGQRALNRPIAELSATRLAARAACLLTHCDSARSEELNELVRRAEAKDSENIIVLYVKALVGLVRYFTRWHPIEEEECRALSHALDRISSYLRYNPLSINLMLYARLVFPGQYEQARALYSESAGRSFKYVSPSINCFNAINALLDGDRVRALNEIREFSARKMASAALALLEPIGAMVLHACGEHAEAHQACTAYICLYPRSEAGLLVYLMGLIQRRATVDAAVAGKRLLRLAPDATVTGILARLSYLPPMIYEWVRQMLTLSDLPR